MADNWDIVTAPEAETSPTLEAIGSEGVHEFVRYFISSGMALGVNVGALTLLSGSLRVPYLWAGAVGFLFGLGVIYLLSIFWVFHKRAFRDWKTELALFALVGVVGLGLNELLLWLLAGIWGSFDLFSNIVSALAVFSWNFGVRKWLLFRG